MCQRVPLMKCKSYIVTAYLCFIQISQTEMKCSDVVQNLWRNISLHFLLQKTGRCTICLQGSLVISGEV